MAHLLDKTRSPHVVDLGRAPHSGRAAMLGLGVVGAGVAAIAVALVLAMAGARPASAGVAPAHPVNGYWEGASDGGIFTFGGAPFQGSMAAHPLNQPIVGLASNRGGGGYWLVAHDGGIFAFGSATFFGSAGGIHLNSPIVGMASTPSGRGYWLVARDGGIFTYGDAGFYGSAGAIRLNAPVVGMAATPTGRGYWLVAADGGIFSYGDARFAGSMGAQHLNSPIVGIAAAPSGSGYWMVAGDGGIFSFGAIPYFGSMGNVPLAQPIVGMLPTPTGQGYWMVAADGGLFSFGDAPFDGSMGGHHLSAPVIGLAAATPTPPPEVAAFYYPWWGNPDFDAPAGTNHDGWVHWNQNGHFPEDNLLDIASDYYPARTPGAHGYPYSSRDPSVVDQQMQDLVRAHIDTAIMSWWGRPSWEDQHLPVVAPAAAAHGIKLAIEIEPYNNPGVVRTIDSVRSDIDYLRTAWGVTDFYIYNASDFSADQWAALNGSLSGVRVFAQIGPDNVAKSGQGAAWAAQGGFTGVYTYDPVAYSGADFQLVCGTAREHGLLCAPSVSPGFSALAAENISGVRPRADGATYDDTWYGAIHAGADLVTITSYNEWHEGSQIEPGQAVIGHASYEGAYGLTGLAAQWAYIDRTAGWVGRYHQTGT